MKIYIIRHGETALNKKGCLQGQINAPLNENGRDLAIVTGKALKDVAFDAAFSSPLDRARETGELVLSQNEASGEVPFTIDARLAEINWGDWDTLGCTKENYELPVPWEEFRTFYTDTMNYPGAPGGESIREVCERAGGFFNELIHRPDLQDKTILIATHGCALRGLLHSLYEKQDDFWQGKVPPNCAVNIVEAKDGIARLVEADKIYYDSSLDNNRYSLKNDGVDYALLAKQLEALAEDEPLWLPVLSNASALLYETLPDLNWAGFYLHHQGSLVLGPFQGKVACVRIALGKGVCGTAAAADKSQLVRNVHEFPGHIACDSASESEIVVPIHRDGQVIGVLDIDSPRLARFDETDREGLEKFVRVLEKVCDFKDISGWLA